MTKVLESKRRLLAYQRKKERCIIYLENHVQELYTRRQTEDDCIRQGEEHLQSLMDHREQLRRQVQDESHQQQSLASQTAQVREAVSNLELDHDNLSKNVATAKKNHDEIVHSIQEFESKHAQALQELESNKAAKSTVVASLTTQLKQIAQSQKTSEMALHEAWKRHEDIRTTHKLGATPANTIPQLEMEFFEKFAENLNEAIGTEKSGKLELIFTLMINRQEMVRIDKQVVGLGRELPQKARLADEQQETLRALAENESRQNKKLAQAQARVAELRAKYEAQLSEQQDNVAKAKELSLGIRQKLSKIESNLQMVRLRCDEKKETLNKRKDTRRRIALEPNDNVGDLQQSINTLSEELQAVSEKYGSHDDEEVARMDREFKEKTETLLVGKVPAHGACFVFMVDADTYSFSSRQPDSGSLRRNRI